MFTEIPVALLILMIFYSTGSANPELHVCVCVNTCRTFQAAGWTLEIIKLLSAWGYSHNLSPCDGSIMTPGKGFDPQPYRVQQQAQQAVDRGPAASVQQSNLEP